MQGQAWHYSSLLLAPNSLTPTYPLEKKLDEFQIIYVTSLHHSTSLLKIYYPCPLTLLTNKAFELFLALCLKTVICTHFKRGRERSKLVENQKFNIIFG